MGKEQANKDYLPPKDQLIIAAKVNRICEAEPSQVNEDLINNMQAVVNALEPRVNYSSNFTFEGSITTQGDSFTGETEHGEFSAQGGERERKFKKGVEKYRIGNYIAFKYKVRDHDDLVFSPFFGAGGANLALGHHPVRTCIGYHKYSDRIELVRLTKANPQIRSLGPILFVRYKQRAIWINKDHK